MGSRQPIVPRLNLLPKSVQVSNSKPHPPKAGSQSHRLRKKTLDCGGRKLVDSARSPHAERPEWNASTRPPSLAPFVRVNVADERECETNQVSKSQTSDFVANEPQSRIVRSDKELEQPHQYHSGGITFMDMLWPGKLVTCSIDGTAALFDAEKHLATCEGTQCGDDSESLPPKVLKFEGHGGPVTHAQRFGSFGLITGSEDRTLRLWPNALQSSSNSKIFEGHTGKVSRVASLFSENEIISASSDATVRVWDASTQAPKVILQCSNTLLRILPNSGGIVSDLLVLHKRNAEILAFHPRMSSIQIWDKFQAIEGEKSSGKLARTASLNLQRGKRLKSKTAKQACTQIVADPGEIFNSIALCEDQTFLCIGTKNGSILQYKLQKVERHLCLTLVKHFGRSCISSEPYQGKHDKSITKITMPPITSLALFRAASRAVYNGRDVDASIANICTDASETKIFAAAGLASGELLVYNLSSGALFSCVQAHKGWVLDISLIRSNENTRQSIDDLLLASCSFDGTVRAAPLKSVPTSPVFNERVHKSTVYAIKFAVKKNIVSLASPSSAPDSRALYLYSAGADAAVRCSKLRSPSTN